MRKAPFRKSIAAILDFVPTGWNWHAVEPHTPGAVWKSYAQYFSSYGLWGMDGQTVCNPIVPETLWVMGQLFVIIPLILNNYHKINVCTKQIFSLGGNLCLCSEISHLDICFQLHQKCTNGKIHKFSGLITHPIWYRAAPKISKVGFSI